jgi:hypothetical protein
MRKVDPRLAKQAEQTRATLANGDRSTTMYALAILANQAQEHRSRALQIMEKRI